jgi:hypothetical protein
LLSLVAVGVVMALVVVAVLVDLEQALDCLLQQEQLTR